MAGGTESKGPPVKKAPTKPTKKAPAKKAPAKKAAVKKAAVKKGPPKKVAPARPAKRTAQPQLPGNAVQRWWARRGKRRAAKKRRIARLSRRRRILRRVGLVLAWLGGGFVLLVCALVVLFYAMTQVPAPSALPLPQAATIEFSDGTVLARVGTQDRTIVSIDHVPEHVRWAILAAEDRDFYNEPGFSATGMLRAAAADVLGGDSQGGSGITQQYVKNAYLSHERTLNRKLRELMIAVKLDQDYPKDQILEFYLNTVYFGRGSYGVEAAAQSYFGKHVWQLSVAEGAVLAASLRDPGYYDPVDNPDAAHDRWQFVVDGMVGTGHLLHVQADALTYPQVQPQGSSRFGVTGPRALIVHRVLAEVEAAGISEQAINTRGLVVHTTIDAGAQTAAEQAIEKTFAGVTAQQRNLKNALVAIDPSSGGVLAYYGGPNGAGYDGVDDQFDYAGLGSRPPGSSFKPYTLATVLSQTQQQEGRTPLAIDSLVDGSYCVSIEGKRICNDPGDEKYSRAKVTIADAMKYSLNTTFDLLAQQAGPDEVAATAHAAGISKTDANGNPTLVDGDGHTAFGIGIGDYAVSPLDQAVGYATLANGGTRHEAHLLERVTEPDGAVIFDYRGEAQRVLDPAVANDVTLTLEPVAAQTGVGLDGGRLSAAKTGTVGMPGASRANSDAWMVGFTPQVSAAVWTGSGDSTTPIVNQWGNPEYGSDLPAHAWQLFMDAYLAGRTHAAMPTTQQIRLK